WRFIGALIAMLAIVSARSAGTQETTGTITGQVTDAGGSAVAGASVTITGGQGVRSATSDAQGRFTVPFLTPGTYAVRADAKGFAPTELKNIPVSIGKPV